MARDAAVTIRVPAELRNRLEAAARKQRRSLSAQVVHELDAALAESSSGTDPGTSVIGMFSGYRVPTEEDLLEVRALLWGGLTGARG